MPERTRKTQFLPESRPIWAIWPVAPVMPAANTSTTTVRTKVARWEGTLATPSLARSAVSPAKTADSAA